MMRYGFLGAIIGLILVSIVLSQFNPVTRILPGVQQTSPSSRPTTPITAIPSPTSTVTPQPTPRAVPQSYEIPQKLHVFQAFNNCGPASFSMLLSYYGIMVSQTELGQKLRPYQNPQGDNDDKSVTIEEIGEEAKTYNLIPYHRPNGSITVLKLLLSNNIPVLVRTWLHPGEDIGHYRIIRGYDDSTQELIQDDSYEGKNLRYGYDTFNAMWQPFNYEYLIIVSREQKDLAEQLLGAAVDEQKAWSSAIERAIEEAQQSSTNPYPVFNQAVALYHKGDFQESIHIFETVQSKLPFRMLWYQIEPIEAYLAAKDYQKVFSLTDSILNNHNRGFTELYILRGKAFLEKGDRAAAKQEFERAVFYNKNASLARELLNKVPSK